MRVTRTLRRALIGALAGAALLVGALSPHPAAAAFVPALYLLSADNSIAMLPAGNGAAPLNPLPVGNLADGQTLVAIDVRPQNGRLYGLAIDASGGLQLYHIDLASGAAVATALSPAPVQFAAGSNVLPDPADSFGIDFNPTVDRLRIVSSGGLNARMNPNTGALIDGDNGGAANSVDGINPDGAISGPASGVSDTAYTNSFANTAVTTQYTLDGATDQLFIQNPPNSGAQTMGLALTLGGQPLDVSDARGLDIPSSVAVSSANSPASGSAFAALTVGDTTGLYRIDLGSGAALPLGAFAEDVRDIAVAITPAAGIALSGDGGQLLRFLVASPASVTAVEIRGVEPGETLVGIDGRPATGQLFGVGVDPTADTATIYLIDPQTGAATLVGAPGQVAFVDAGGDPIDLPPPSAGYGVDFNPTVDRIRFVNGAGLNARLNQLTGGPVDGNDAADGVQPDGAISGVAGGVEATAYTNNFRGVNGAVFTTQYTLDAAGNQLSIQNPPNSGAQTMALAVTLAGQPLDFSAASGFDIPPGVRVAASNSPAQGLGYAALTVDGTTGLYTIDLASGEASLIGPIGAGASGVSGLAVWSAPARVGLFLPLVQR